MQTQTTPPPAAAALAELLAALTTEEIADRLLLERLASGYIEEAAAAVIAKGRTKNPFAAVTSIFAWPFISSVDWLSSHLADFTGDPVESALQSDNGEVLPVTYLPAEPRFEKRTKEATFRLPADAAAALLRHLASGKIQKAAQAFLDSSPAWPDAVALAAILKAPNARAPFRAVAFWRASIIVSMTGERYVAAFASDDGEPHTLEFLPAAEPLQ